MNDSLRDIFQKRRSRAIKIFIAVSVVISFLVSVLGVKYIHKRKIRFSENLIQEYVTSLNERQIGLAAGKIDESTPFPYPQNLYNSVEQYYSAVEHAQEFLQNGFQYSYYTWFFLLCFSVTFIVLTLFVLPVVVGAMRHVKLFACPHCRKTIVVKDLDYACPSCGKPYHGSEADLFLKCFKCKNSIPAVACPHCGQSIDLKAPFDSKKLE